MTSWAGCCALGPAAPPGTACAATGLRVAATTPADRTDADSTRFANSGMDHAPRRRIKGSRVPKDPNGFAPWSIHLIRGIRKSSGPRLHPGQTGVAAVQIRTLGTRSDQPVSRVVNAALKRRTYPTVSARAELSALSGRYPLRISAVSVQRNKC